MNYDLLIDKLTCKFGHNSCHLLNNPKELPCCRTSVCDSCIIKACGELNNIFKCTICKETVRIGINSDGECELEKNIQVQNDLDHYTIDINHYLLRRLETQLSNVEERFASNHEYLEKRKQFIEKEIHTQVEGLNAQLDEFENDMKDKLNNSCLNANINIKSLNELHKPRLYELKNSIGHLKITAFSYANNVKLTEKDGDHQTKEEIYLNKLPQQHSVNNILNNLETLSQMNKSISENIEDIKFYPNIEPISHGTIGNLKEVKEINLEEHFKVIKKQHDLMNLKSISNSNKKMPISPKSMCVLDSHNLLFTDTHTKQLIQITMETGDYVRSTTLKGALKSPDGICINHKKGFIYVVDSDICTIFKLDKSFNLLKKFGSKDLKYPRHIFYDAEATASNCLYVCDYLNQRIAIFNDQDQLRDEIVMSNEDKLVPCYRTIKSRYDSIEMEEEFKFQPLSVMVTKQHVYVSDHWTNANCIRVFDKSTKSLLRNIGDLQAWNPMGLAIDDNENVFTLGKLYYETGLTYLFCFDKNGKLLYKTNLGIQEWATDFVIDKYTDISKYGIIGCADYKIHYIRFE